MSFLLALAGLIFIVCELSKDKHTKASIKAENAECYRLREELLEKYSDADCVAFEKARNRKIYGQGSPTYQVNLELAQKILELSRKGKITKDLDPLGDIYNGILGWGKPETSEEILAIMLEIDQNYQKCGIGRLIFRTNWNAPSDYMNEGWAYVSDLPLLNISPPLCYANGEFGVEGLISKGGKQNYLSGKQYHYKNAVQV